MRRVWQRLLAGGVPQTQDFKLVFVGRFGWLMNDLFKKIGADLTLGDSLLLLPNVDDSTLSSLYNGAAFCLYPSQYEGFGLPIVEAFSHGKAVIASTGGAIPEVVGEFSPCLDSGDDEAWYTTFKRWIIDPKARVSYEEAIRARFPAITWNDAAQYFFQSVERESRQPRDERRSD